MSRLTVAQALFRFFIFQLCFQPEAVEAMRRLSVTASTSAVHEVSSSQAMGTQDVVSLILKLAFKVIEEMGSGTLAVVQLDPETFDKPNATIQVEYNFNRTEKRHEKFGPAGRAMYMRENKWPEGWERKLLQFGASTKIKVKGSTELMIANHFETRSYEETVESLRLRANIEPVETASYELDNYEPVETNPVVSCENSGSLSGGRLYVYTGGCGKTAFKDITGFDRGTKIGHQFFSDTFCGTGKFGRSKSLQVRCMQHLACAIDEIYWANAPGVFQGSTIWVDARPNCPNAGSKTREGLFHKHESCECQTSGCDFCGTQGLCCQSSWNPMAKKVAGCEGLGCLTKKCCVAKPT